jgi:diadenosine tetraphosphatase ApaH/serine/threonine PP2A family protein phosphatase
VQLALLSDVHANLEALDAVLRDLERRAPGARLVCSGDVVGYGPDPEPCIERLQARGALFVMGNHEEMILGRRDFSRCVYAGILAAVWTRDHLSPETKAFLQALPTWSEAAPGIVICHGDLENAGTYVSTEAAARRALDQLDRLRRGARMLVCGHTHRPAFFAERIGFASPARVTEFVLPQGEACLVNPGSVGQAREGRPLARYALVNLERGTVRYAAVEYDHVTTVRKLRRRRLVARVVLPPPRGIARRIEHLKARAARRWATWRSRRSVAGGGPPCAG